mmetsp:Transcript_1317/g.3594  ORF Transcript_1317/g.3594 Transcript_1317/m.3594 type:complete len:225 (+) Transcript_1317:626-1300(+)
MEKRSGWKGMSLAMKAKLEMPYSSVSGLCSSFSSSIFHPAVVCDSAISKSPVLMRVLETSKSPYLSSRGTIILALGFSFLSRAVISPSFSSPSFSRNWDALLTTITLANSIWSSHNVAMGRSSFGWACLISLSNTSINLCTSSSFSPSVFTCLFFSSCCNRSIGSFLAYSITAFFCSITAFFCSSFAYSKSVSAAPLSPVAPVLPTIPLMLFASARVSIDPRTP